MHVETKTIQHLLADSMVNNDRDLSFLVEQEEVVHNVNHAMSLWAIDYGK